MVGMLLCIYLDMARVNSGNNIFHTRMQLIDLYTHIYCLQPKKKQENKQLEKERDCCYNITYTAHARLYNPFPPPKKKKINVGIHP